MRARPKLIESLSLRIRKKDCSNSYSSTRLRLNSPTGILTAKTTLFFWDNRACQHLALADYVQDPSTPRVIHRLTVPGIQAGRFYNSLKARSDSIYNDLRVAVRHR
jgi:hypothetical protein